VGKDGDIVEIRIGVGRNEVHLIRRCSVMKKQRFQSKETLLH